MTIKNLSVFIKKKILKNHPEIIEKIHIDQFKNQTIVLDLLSWFFGAWIKSRQDCLTIENIMEGTEPQIWEIRSKWSRSLLGFINYFLSKGIKLIIVIDGDTLPEKMKIKEKRRKENEEKFLEIQKLREEIKTNVKIDPLFKINELYDKLKKKVFSYSVIPPDEYTYVQKFISNTGLPLLRSVGDAERLCSVLCREKVAIASYSTDIDNLAFGCPLYIKDYDAEEFVCYRLDKLLKALNMNYDQFVDFCIMCGCDYNGKENIYKVGPGKSFDEISKNGRIENISLEYNYDCLNHIRCRELIYPQRSENLIEKRIWPDNMSEEDIKNTNIFDIVVNSLDFNEKFYYNYDDDNENGRKNSVLEFACNRLKYSIFTLENITFNNFLNIDYDILNLNGLCNIKQRIYKKKPKTTTRKRVTKNITQKNTLIEDDKKNIVTKDVPNELKKDVTNEVTNEVTNDTDKNGFSNDKNVIKKESRPLLKKKRLII